MSATKQAQPRADRRSALVLAGDILAEPAHAASQRPVFELKPKTP